MSTMSEVDKWDCNIHLTEHLAKALNKGKLAIFLGAGISKYFGCPDWNELIDSVFESKKAKRPLGQSNTDSAEYLRTEVFDNNTSEFNLCIKDNLYKSVELDYYKLRENHTLASIASLAMGRSGQSVSTVVTLNYDDFLETYLKFHGYYSDSIFDSIHWQPNADVAVYHPHGFMPLEDSHIYGDIIIDSIGFSSIIGDVGNPWHQKLLNVMSTHICLFIGMSGEDSNIDNLLAKALKQNPAIEKDSDAFFGVSFSTNDSSAFKWKNRKIFLKQVSGYDRELPEFLFGVSQKAAEFRQKA